MLEVGRELLELGEEALELGAGGSGGGQVKIEASHPGV
jgi:hypothetical protein